MPQNKLKQLLCSVHLTQKWISRHADIIRMIGAKIISLKQYFCNFYSSLILSLKLKHLDNKNIPENFLHWPFCSHVQYDLGNFRFCFSSHK